MNIIQAREAAIAGKTVTCPSGFNYSKASFSNVEEWDKASIFGEWRIKQEPVVFESEVSIANETLYGCGVGMIASREMRSLLGKRVKVTVDVLP